MRFNTKKDENGNDVADPLISEEVYETAKLAITKKYEDEKLKVRQEYNIAKTNDIHQAEFDALKVQLDKKLLTEQEFEEAKLKLKLKHAQEFAQKAEQYIQLGSNAVGAIEKAQTASVDAEYTKRGSALTDQFNNGLITQEEYNKQKKKLEYEQKVKRA